MSLIESHAYRLKPPRKGVPLVHSYTLVSVGPSASPGGTGLAGRNLASHLPGGLDARR